MRILVVDDDPAFNQLVSNYLQRQGFTITSRHSSKGGLEELAMGKFDLVLADYKLPDLDGLTLIKKIKSSYEGMPVILITNYADIRVAVDSIKLGAYEFVTKPVNPDELLKVIQQAMIKSDVQSETEQQKITSTTEYVIGKNTHANHLWKHVTMVAPTKMCVLMIGESGTGKEHIARTIHKLSRRNKGPFVAVDCGALSIELAGSELFGHVKGAFTGAHTDKKGLFEEAHGGTLFMDEVGNLPYEVQVLLLRAIQEGTIKKVGNNQEVKVDVRLIAATNEDLDSTSEESTFRNDLYHRLNEFELNVPPLRDRLDDLDEYCQFFIEQACIELEKSPMPISTAVKDIFQTYHWPGNLRELKNIIRRAVLLATGDEITTEALPTGLTDGYRKKQAGNHASPAVSSQPEGLNIKNNNQAQEKELIEHALEKYKYNKTKAASALNIDRSTLYYKIKQYSIDC